MDTGPGSDSGKGGSRGVKEREYRCKSEERILWVIKEAEKAFAKMGWATPRGYEGSSSAGSPCSELAELELELSDWCNCV